MAGKAKQNGPQRAEWTAERREQARQAATDAAAKSHAVFETAEEFEAAANAYFDACDHNGELYSEGGLCLALTDGNRKNRTVTPGLMQKWYSGESCQYLQDAVQRAYLRIQKEIETNPVYREKGMPTLRMFLQKQTRLGGYQDKVETKNNSSVEIVLKNGMDMELFK